LGIAYNIYRLLFSAWLEIRRMSTEPTYVLAYCS
jgi:hypothetical protein